MFLLGSASAHQTVPGRAPDDL